MEAATCVQSQATGPTYVRRQPEKTALYQVLQQHLLTFEQQWTDEANGRTLPKFVLDELHGFMSCGILAKVRYFGVLSSHASSRSQVVPHTPPPAVAQADPDKPKRRFRYIRWSELLRRVFGVEVVCAKCKAPLRLISLIKSEPIAKKILVAMHLPSDAPELCPARGPPEEHRESPDGEDCVN